MRPKPVRTDWYQQEQQQRLQQQTLPSTPTNSNYSDDGPSRASWTSNLPAGQSSPSFPAFPDTQQGVIVISSASPDPLPRPKLSAANAANSTPAARPDTLRTLQRSRPRPQLISTTFAHPPERRPLPTRTTRTRYMAPVAIGNAQPRIRSTGSGIPGADNMIRHPSHHHQYRHHPVASSLASPSRYTASSSNPFVLHQGEFQQMAYAPAQYPQTPTTTIGAPPLSTPSSGLPFSPSTKSGRNPDQYLKRLPHSPAPVFTGYDHQTRDSHYRPQPPLPPSSSNHDKNSDATMTSLRTGLSATNLSPKSTSAASKGTGYSYQQPPPPLSMAQHDPQGNRKRRRGDQQDHRHHQQPIPLSASGVRRKQQSNVKYSRINHNSQTPSKYRFQSPKHRDHISHHSNHHVHHPHNRGAQRSQQSSNSTSQPYKQQNQVQSQQRHQPQQKAAHDDSDGHFIVVPETELTPRYTIVRQLGQGTFGKVAECVDHFDKTRVAVKIIRAVPKYREASQLEIRVLNTLRKADPSGSNKCIKLLRSFDFCNHVCMVFPLLGNSLFDFIKANAFQPFTLMEIKQIGQQLLESVAFLHGLKLIHTDLKPENILFEQQGNDSQVIEQVLPAASASKKTRVVKRLIRPKIRLIDFGSATFETEYHSLVVSTRHYRAPEIILDMGWSYPCDMWSIGCILVEFFTGEALFQTHNNLEHLAMMQAVIGRFPSNIVNSVGKHAEKYFRDSYLVYPSTDTPSKAIAYIKAMQALREIVKCGEVHKEEVGVAFFYDLVKRLLTYDPSQRITAAEALKHHFFGDTWSSETTDRVDWGLFNYQAAKAGSAQRAANPAQAGGRRFVPNHLAVSITAPTSEERRKRKRPLEPYPADKRRVVRLEERRPPRTFQESHASNSQSRKDPRHSGEGSGSGPMRGALLPQPTSIKVPPSSSTAGAASSIPTSGARTQADLAASPSASIHGDLLQDNGQHNSTRAGGVPPSTSTVAATPKVVGIATTTPTSRGHHVDVAPPVVSLQGAAGSSFPSSTSSHGQSKPQYSQVRKPVPCCSSAPRRQTQKHQIAPTSPQTPYRTAYSSSVWKPPDLNDSAMGAAALGSQPCRSSAIQGGRPQVSGPVYEVNGRGYLVVPATPVNCSRRRYVSPTRSYGRQRSTNPVATPAGHAAVHHHHPPSGRSSIMSTATPPSSLSSPVNAHLVTEFSPLSAAGGYGRYDISPNHAYYPGYGTRAQAPPPPSVGVSSPNPMSLRCSNEYNHHYPGDALYSSGQPSSCGVYSPGSPANACSNAPACYSSGGHEGGAIAMGYEQHSPLEMMSSPPVKNYPSSLQVVPGGPAYHNVLHVSPQDPHDQRPVAPFGEREEMHTDGVAALAERGHYITQSGFSARPSSEYVPPRTEFAHAAPCGYDSFPPDASTQYPVDDVAFQRGPPPDLADSGLGGRYYVDHASPHVALHPHSTDGGSCLPD